MKKRILTVNCIEDNGSIPKIIADIEKHNPQYEYYHSYQVGPKPVDGNNYIVAPWRITQLYYALARIVGIKYGIGSIPTLLFIKHIKKINPDIIHIHCPNFYSLNLYMLFDYLKKSNIATVVTNHAEFFYTGNCAHANECMKFTMGCHHCARVFDNVHPFIINRTHYEWKKMKKAFANADNIVMTVVSPWQAKRIKMSPIIPETMSITTVFNGVDTDIFNYLGISKIELRKKLQLPTDNKIALHVSSNFSDEKDGPKGGWYLLETAKKLPEVVFVVLGSYRLTGGHDIPDNVKILGNISDQNTLSEYYNAADVTVITSKRETFGMTYAESLCCGTKAVGFNNGGTESIAIEESSDFCEYGNVEGLVGLISKELSDTYNNADISNKAKDKYSSIVMAQKYGDIYNELCNRKID